MLELAVVSKYFALLAWPFLVNAENHRKSFAILIPLINGCLTAAATASFIADPGNRFLLAILAASASYIAVPAAMRMAVPQANPSLYLPMALAITFPFNITLGMPLYLFIIQTIS